MRIVTLDFETYFDSEYTLSKLTTEEYVRDPRFEAHGAAVLENGRCEWLSPEALHDQCATWSASEEPVAMLCHHAHFDGLILSHHFGYKPDIWLDSLSMARVLFGPDTRKGLDALAARFDLTPKSVPYQEMKGKRWPDMDTALRARVADGAIHDCRLASQIAWYMLGMASHPAVPYPFPASELPVVDMTIRMFTEPVLIGDIEKLGEAWTAENEAKKDLFARLSALTNQEITPPLLRKDVCFAELLQELGVEPQTKHTQKVEKYAFAKSDYFMQDLLYDQDPDVALLVEARLKAQSSIYQTRLERYGNMALRGPLCVYLAYAAAHTRRWGGGDKTNFQNLPRPDGRNPKKGALRRAIVAP